MTLLTFMQAALAGVVIGTMVGLVLYLMLGGPDVPGTGWHKDDGRNE